MENSTVSTGRRGEEIVAAYLEEIGYSIERRNFRLYGAEVDIIARRADTLHFVEVKRWRSFDRSELEYAIDGRKQHRIARACRGYLASLNESEVLGVSFDVALVDPSDDSIRYIQRAFEIE